MDPTDRLDAVQLLKEQFQELMERQQKLIKRAVFSGSRNAKVGLRVACWRLCVRTLLRHRHENVENVLVQQIGTFCACSGRIPLKRSKPTAAGRGR
jgi:hypothetical protein